MFILLDPKKDKSGELLKRFRHCLMERKHYFPVLSGRFNDNLFNLTSTEEEASKLIDTLLASDFSKIGARHGQPLGYHFAMAIHSEKKEARLTTYITEWYEKKDIHHQVKAMSEILKLQHGIKQLILPFNPCSESDAYFLFETLSDGCTTKITNLITS